MRVAPETHRLGPGDGRLLILTGTDGPAARAGHALTIAATAWTVTLTFASSAADHQLEVTVDPTSLVVQEGRGGVSPLSDEDKGGISSTIRDEILGGAPIEFRSTQVTQDGDGNELSVRGNLELAGVSRPVKAIVRVHDSMLSAEVRLRQSDFGIKPYSVLFGALKVADEVAISFDVTLPDGSHQ